MSALIEKIRQGRAVRVPVRDGVVIIARRPTDLDMIECRGRMDARQCMSYVTGWEGVTEIVIAGNGEPHPLQFDAELAKAWIEDDVEILSKLIEALVTAYQEHSEKVESAKKK